MSNTRSVQSVPPKNSSIEAMHERLAIAKCATLPHACFGRDGAPYKSPDGSSGGVEKFYGYLEKNLNQRQKLPPWYEAKEEFEALAVAECASKATLIFKNDMEIYCREAWMRFYKTTYDYIA
jgi:hypothetical protein